MKNFSHISSTHFTICLSWAKQILASDSTIAVIIEDAVILPSRIRLSFRVSLVNVLIVDPAKERKKREGNNVLSSRSTMAD